MLLLLLLPGDATPGNALNWLAAANVGRIGPLQLATMGQT